MTQYSSLEQQVIALAGVVQAARMVDQVAKTGSYPAAFFEASLRSLFVFDAPSVDAVYGNVQGVKLGLRSVVDMLTDATNEVLIRLLRSPYELSKSLEGLKRPLRAP